MPALLAEATSLVTTRSVTNTRDGKSDADGGPSSGGLSTLSELVKAGIGIAFGFAYIIYGILHYIVFYHYRFNQPDSEYFITHLFTPSSQHFIFKRCCGKKRKACGPLEQDYETYDMIRPLGQHHGDDGVIKCFDNAAVTEDQKMLEEHRC